MATPPKPNPLHNVQPPAPPSPATSVQERVNLHGIPPKPNMAEPPPDEDKVNDATVAEMDAGRKALGEYQKRTQAEHAYGKKAISRLNPEVTPESKEPPPSPP